MTVVPFLSGFTDAMRGDWDTQIVNLYRQRHPNVTIDLVPQTGPTVERVQKMTALMAGGAALDLGDGPLGLRAMVAQNRADPAIDALIKRDKYDTKKYNQAHFQAGSTLEGKILALPYRYGGNVMCLACNVNLFKEAGVALPPADVSRPWTWEEFVTALTRLTRRAGADVSVFGLAGPGWIVGSWPPLWKTDWISPDLKTITCDTKEMQDCYTRLGELFGRLHVVPQTGRGGAPLRHRQPVQQRQGGDPPLPAHRLAHLRHPRRGGLRLRPDAQGGAERAGHGRRRDQPLQRQQGHRRRLGVPQVPDRGVRATPSCSV